MAKGKKHGKVAKASKGAGKKNNKSDNKKRMAKYADPASSVSRDMRATYEALAQEIERDARADALVPDKKAAPAKKAVKRKQLYDLALQEGIDLKNGMTKKQALKIVSKKQTRPQELHNVPAPDYVEDGDGEDEGHSADEDFSDTANERAKEYRRGGYHPVLVGEIYNDRYRVVKKLGWGYFSTVWLVWDYKEERYQAMKIQKSAREYSEAAYDEIELLSQIMKADPHKTRCCARLNEYFQHTGPNGTHVCMVFDVYGENLLSLMERYEYKGIPLPIVKCISRQILIGLEHIHSIDIIHTDLKPENVLLSTPKHAIISLMRHFHPPPLHQRPKLTERDPKTMTKSQRRRYYKKLAKEKERQLNGGHVTDDSEDDEDDDDGGGDNERGSRGKNNDHTGDNDESEASMTDPEWEVERFHHVILADFGNSCWTYKQFTEEVQTRQYRCPEVILGEKYSTPIDIWSFACMIFELISGEFLFDPKKGETYSRDEDHLALMSELLGELPEQMRLGEGKFRSYFYNSHGELRNIKDLRFWSLEDLLHQKHKYTREKAKEIASFLLPMLRYRPEDRATASEMLRDFDDFFEIKEDDYEPLCFVADENQDSNNGSASGEDEERLNGSSSDSYEYEEEEEDAELYDDDDDDDDDDSIPRATVHRRAPRARQPPTDAERVEAFRYWEEHPILNRTALEQKGLTIQDIHKVIDGQTLEDPVAQEAAYEVIQLLSDETDRLSSDIASDGHDADHEDACDADDDNDVDDGDDSTQNSEEDDGEEDYDEDNDDAEYTR